MPFVILFCSLRAHVYICVTYFLVHNIHTWNPGIALNQHIQSLPGCYRPAGGQLGVHAVAGHPASTAPGSSPGTGCMLRSGWLTPRRYSMIRLPSFSSCGVLWHNICWPSGKENTHQFVNYKCYSCIFEMLVKQLLTRSLQSTDFQI